MGPRAARTVRAADSAERSGLVEMLLIQCRDDR
jgi:hypothetical protein